MKAALKEVQEGSWGESTGHQVALQAEQLVPACLEVEVQQTQQAAVAIVEAAAAVTVVTLAGAPQRLCSETLTVVCCLCEQTD